MKLLQRVDSIMGLFGLEPKATKNGRGRPDMPDWWHTIGEQGAWGEGVPDAEIYKNQAERYISSPAFYAGVNRIAEAGAMTQIKVFAGSENDAKEINPHPFLDLLKRPAPNMEWLSLDRFTLIESILASLAITGNSYLYLGGRSAPTQAPTMLLPLRPDRLTVLPDKEVGVKGYKYLVGSQEWQIAVADIVHIRRFHPLNDFVGLSQTEPANYALATDFAAQQHNWATFKNSARLSVVIESDAQHIDPADKEMMEQYWRDTYTGDPAKAHQVAFLWGGFQAKDFGQNMRDAEYIQGRKLNRSDILMTLGIHPGLLMAEDVNLANSKTAEYLFAKYTLLPLVSRIVFRLNAEIMPLYGEGQELRAIDVVPRDEIYNAQVAATQAGAAKTLIDALGAKEGVAEAKRQKLLSAEVQEPKEEPEPQPEPPPAPVAPQTPPPPEVEQPEPPKFNPNHDEQGRFAEEEATLTLYDDGRFTITNASGEKELSAKWTYRGGQLPNGKLPLQFLDAALPDDVIIDYSNDVPEFAGPNGETGTAVLHVRNQNNGVAWAGVEEDGGSISLSHLFANKPGTGLGTELMKALKLYADARQKPLVVYKVVQGAHAYWRKFSWLEQTGPFEFQYTPASVTPKSLAPTEAADLAAVAEQFARAAEALAEAKMAADQPRIPAGQPGGGQWVDVGGEQMYRQGDEGRARGGAATFGINERVYRGGQFLPSTPEQRIEKADRLTAQRMRKYMERKQEVGPYQYEKPPHPDYVPLTVYAMPGALTTYVGGYGNKRMVVVEQEPEGFVRKITDGTGLLEGRPWRETMQMYADAWNAGNRWVYDPELAAVRMGNAKELPDADDAETLWAAHPDWTWAQVKAELLNADLPEPTPAPPTATHGFTTAMLAFFPTVTRPPLADLPDGAEPVPDADLHVTLAFLGDTAALELSATEIALRVEQAAANLPVLTGKFGGAVTFTSADGQQPFCATIDAPALQAWRAALLRLTGLDAYADDTHGYTPHMTLAYLPIGTQPPTMTAPDAEIMFDTVTLTWDDARYTFPLRGGPVADAGALEALGKFNAYHKPAGPGGGQFTSGAVVRFDPPDQLDPDLVY